MHKGKPSKSSKFRSIKIDRLLQQEHEQRKREVQLLLVGPPQSGKNTVCKQIRIHFGDGFPTATRMSLIPIILANLADAVALVLLNMKNLQVEFEDSSARELATSLLDALPCEGSFTEIVQRNCCPNETGDKQAVEFYASSNGVDECLFDRSRNTAQEAAQNKLKFLMSEQEAILECAHQQDVINPSIARENLDETNEETVNLHDAVIRALRDHDSIPPSLMKRLEMITNKAVIQDLQSAGHNPVQFQSLLLRCVGSELDGNNKAASNEFRPPSPSTPPPKTFEDELIDCLMEENQESDDTITSSNTVGTGSVSEIFDENGKPFTSENNHWKCNPDENLLLADTNLKKETVTSPCSCLGNDLRSTFNQKKHLSLQLNPELINFIEFLEGSSSNPVFLQSLKIVLKLLTEQPEFQAIITQRDLTEPSVTYADSYFVTHVDRIIQEDYVPTLQDLLVTREPSKAIRETLTSVGITYIRTIDMAEQGGYPNRHLHYFESVNTVLFLVSLIECVDSKNSSIRENKLSEYIRLFESLITSPYMARKDIVVLLNKLDLVKSTSNQVSRAQGSDSAETDGTDALMEKIQHAFLQAVQKQNSQIGRISFQVSCALDVDQMKYTIHECLRGPFEPNKKRHIFP
ncbi:hypothetical protein D915_002867 [Fasciola hepatica]|uniref:Uncharacterized protein n=1 Tax=Fasciola hepatica TaxID=6192 RepID=A0A4E0RH05_FASHE|nr:hypothetical protein D915_002867 [Fasciola hepatica]